MSKRAKRLLSLLMVLAMVMSLGTPAFALGGGREIGIGGGFGRDIGDDEIREFDPTDYEEEGEDPVDYFQATDTESGITVTVESPFNALPTKAEVRLQPVDPESVREAVETVVEGQPNILVAMDISFWIDGQEIEPDQPVNVKISAPEITGRSDLQVVHIPDAGEEAAQPNTVQLITEDEMTLPVGTNEIAFKADSFSVYAVIGGGETGDEARITVNFKKGDTTVATVYVKNSDELLAEGEEKQPGHSYINDIVYDPGVGDTLSSGQMFRGWSLDVTNVSGVADKSGYVGKNYVNDTEGMTIGELRTFLKDLTITEGDVLDVYAMIFNVYHVTFEDPDGITVASDVVLMSTNVISTDYTITHTYEVTGEEGQTQHFEGWKVKEGGSNISEAKYNGEDIVAPEGGYAVYPQGSTMKLSGDVIFSTDVSQGHWLVFEENAYGATYNAPLFIKGTEVSREPALPMTCNGYSFEGWYKLKEGETLTDADKDGDYYVIGDKFEAFTFGQPLEDRTVLYAKWTVASTANYTVIVWKQSVVDDKAATDAQKTYDFAFSTQISADSNTPVSSLDLSAYQNKDGDSITVDGKSYSFYGFKYNSTMTAKEGSVTIGNGVVANKDKVMPNNTTVINLYYDRELVTYDFNTEQMTEVTPKPSGSAMNNGEYYIYYNNQYCVIRYRDRENSYIYDTRYYLYSPTTSNYGTQYAYVNGTWYELDYDTDSAGTGYYWWYQDSNGWHTYSGTRYTQTSNSFTNLNSYTVYTKQWKSRDTFTGLYGQKLSKYNYTWPTDYRWINDIGGSTFTSVMDMFGSSVNENPSSEFHSDFYAESTTYNTNVYHFLQNVDGSYSSSATYTIPTVIGNGMVFRNFQGFTASEFRISLPSGVSTYTTGTSYNGDNLVNPVSHTSSNGWTDWLPYGTGVEYNGNTRHETTRWQVTAGGIEFRYTRDQFDLTYMVGRFVNSSGEVLTAPISTLGKVEEDIPYESNMAAYAEGGEKYYNPDAQTPQTGFVFAGWYIDETCTTPVDFAHITMPMNGMSVYGKWQQVEYRVFMKPGVPETDTSLFWGKDDQAMNFRIAYNGKVSLPTGERTGYEFGGWYTDEGLTTAYNADTRLTDTTVPATPVYDKTADFTDGADGSEMNIYGNINSNTTGINKDVSRSWITRKLVLYARWSKVLDGAEGIGIVYDATADGHNEPRDTLLYKDNVRAIAQAASTANNDSMIFGYWVLQRWDAGSNAFVDVEGSHYYPGEAFPVLEEYAHKEAKADGSGNTYTVKLRAQYVSKDAPLPTYITWYSNVYDIAGNLIPDAQSKLGSSNPSTAEMPYTQLAFDAAKGIGFKREDVQINKAIEIPAPTTFTMQGYKFLGWGRIDLSASTAKGASGITDPSALDETNLFLKWVEDNAETHAGHYEAKMPTNAASGNGVAPALRAGEGDTSWQTVQYVAADEDNPYQDLYAVWAGEFKVYHTGVAGGAVETIQMTRGLGTYDLTQHLGGKGVTRDGEAPSVLYGGYYLADGLTTPTELVDGLYPAYDGTNWTFTTAQTKNGMEITPVAGETYYVKEVPAADFLQPRLRYTYRSIDGKIGTAWLATNLDDGNYGDVGFMIGSAPVVCSDGNKVTSFTMIPQSDESQTVTYYVGTAPEGTGTKQPLFLTGSFFSYQKVYNKHIYDTKPALNYGEEIETLKAGEKVVMFWVTPDGMKVTSTVTRTYANIETTAMSVSDKTPQKSSITLYSAS